MAHSDHDRFDDADDSADTASFQRFVEQSEGHGEPAPVDNGRSFRLLSLGIGAVVLIVIVLLLFR